RKTLPILTVGEDDFFINNGGIVSLQIINGKVSISVNVKAAKTSNLNISARVLKLATVIQ
ncbi:MAG: YfiR family protein, partial [Methylococcales bacterium]